MVVRRQLLQLDQRCAEKVSKDTSSLLPSATECLENDCGSVQDKVTSQMPRQAQAMHVFKRYKSYDGGASVETQSVMSDCTSPTRGWSSGEDLPANPDMSEDENPDLEAFGDLAWEVGESSNNPTQNFSDVDFAQFNGSWNAVTKPDEDMQPEDMQPEDTQPENTQHQDTKPKPEDTQSTLPESPMPTWVSKMLDRATQGDSAVKDAFFWIPQPAGNTKERKGKRAKARKEDGAPGTGMRAGAGPPSRTASRAPRPRPRSWDGSSRTTPRHVEIPRRAVSRQPPSLSRDRDRDSTPHQPPQRKSPNSMASQRLPQREFPQVPAPSVDVWGESAPDEEDRERSQDNLNALREATRMASLILKERVRQEKAHRKRANPQASTSSIHQSSSSVSARSSRHVRQPPGLNRLTAPTLGTPRELQPAQEFLTQGPQNPVCESPAQPFEADDNSLHQFYMIQPRFQ